MVSDWLHIDGRKIRLVWHPDLPLRGNEEISQVSGLCLTPDHQLLLVSEDAKFWTLPGGHPEPNETPVQTLAREVWEEACARVTACRYLGAQRVDDPGRPRPHYQLRFLARVELEPFRPKHEVRHRKLTDKHEAQELLWGGDSLIARQLLSIAFAQTIRFDWPSTGPTLPRSEWTGR